MKKYIILLLLGSLCAGCASVSTRMMLKPDMRFEDLEKSGNGILLGGITFEAVPGDIKGVNVIFVDEEKEKVFPAIITGEPEIRFGDNPKMRQVSFYYFIQLPEGKYHLQQIIAAHEKFEPMEHYLLNANLTFQKNSIRYIGTVHLKAVGRVMTILGPILESEIVDDRANVIRAFRKQYPQFNEYSVTSKVIDRYEFFREDGIGGEF